MTNLNNILRSSRVFKNLPEESYPVLLHCLRGVRKCYERDEMIVNIGDLTQTSGLILSGKAEKAFLDENGNQILVGILSEGDVFGIEYCSENCNTSHVSLHSLSACEVLFLDFKNIFRPSANRCPCQTKLVVCLLREFAEQNQFLNLKLHILGQKYLRDKLRVYLKTLPQEKDGSIRLPFDRRELAEFLYADRSSLSRELARMKNDGILDFRGSVITILDKDFLQD